MQKQEVKDYILRVAGSRFIGGNCTLIALALIAVFSLFFASAQETNTSKPDQPATSAVAPKVINIWPGVAPGSEQWKQKEATISAGPMK